MTAFALRLASTGDRNSIFSDWLKSARKCPTYQGITSQVFFFWMHLTIEQLLDEPSCTWLVACAPNDPTKIYGWLCGQRADTLAGDQAVVHYVYTKKNYRRVGVASRLFEQFVGVAPITVATSLSEVGREFLGDRPYLFNPFLLFAWVPGSAIKLRKNHPTNLSRRALASGGYVPSDTGEDEP